MMITHDDTLITYDNDWTVIHKSLLNQPQLPPFRTKDEDSEVERGGESVMATGCVSEI